MRKLKHILSGGLVSLLLAGNLMAADDALDKGPGHPNLIPVLQDSAQYAISHHHVWTRLMTCQHQDTDKSQAKNNRIKNL
jgi:hypothetical protein